MNKQHHYRLTNKWTGNKGTGTSNVRNYERNHTISIDSKPDLNLTTDNAAVGDNTKLNPEDLLVSAISSCHLLSYLYVCALNGVIVLDYVDHATGVMIENENGGGKFSSVTLNPEVIVAESSMIEKANHLHHTAHEMCYIANSVNFGVICNPKCTAK